jgi:glycerate kinase
LKVLLIPDSFKGSLTAKEVSILMAKIVKKIIPKSDIIYLPFSDGGEGALDLLRKRIEGKIIYCQTNDPLMRKIKAPFFLFKNEKTAWIELSQAAGINLLNPKELNPLKTSTWGVGVLIKHALNMGCKKIILGIGGSSTHDLGTGIFSALGGQLLDKENNVISLGGEGLKNCSKINNTLLDPRIKNCEIIIATDVNNPLVGKNGAAKTYAKQKGASENDILQLEKNTIQFSDLIENYNLIKIKKVLGGGAAGGSAAGLYGLMGAKIKNGFDLLSKLYDLEKIILKSDLVITGEGHFDSQSLYGKLPIRIVTLTSKFKIPTIIMAGFVTIDKEKMQNSNLGIYSAKPKNMSLNSAIINARENLEKKLSMVLKHFIKTKKFI